MNRLPDYIKFGTGFGDKVRPFNLVIVYEDSIAGSRAVELLMSLVDALGQKYLFKLDVWDGRNLTDTTTLHKAAEVTSHADMVVVATNSMDRLSPGISDWISAWKPLKSGNRLSALVALLCKDSEAGNPVSEHLRELAGQTGMDFFCSNEVASVLEAAAPTREMTVKRGVAMNLRKQKARMESVRHWGINE